MYILPLAVLITGFLDYANCQCNGTAEQISSIDGVIQSPNYPDEYGKVASCSWNFTRPPDGDYLLELTIATLRLYFEDTNNQECPGSYELSIAGETVGCTRYVNDTDPSTQFCIAFDSSCVSQRSQCESVRNFPSTLEVTYTSNGERFRNQTVIGFRIEYNYIRCNTTEDNSATTTTSTQGVPAELPLAIGLGVVAGILLIISIAMVGYCLWRRQKSRRDGQAMSSGSTRDTPEDLYENDTLPRKPKRAMMPPNAHRHVYVNETAARQPSSSRSVESGYEGSGYNNDIQL